VTVNVTPDGFIEIGSATQAMGQGIATSYAQLAVDVLRRAAGAHAHRAGRHRPLQRLRQRRQPLAVHRRHSVKVAAERTVDKGKELAADALEAPVADIEYREGRFTVAGTDLGIDLAALAGRQAEQRIFVDSTATVGGPTWPNGCHVCEVEIDPATGDVQIVAYASVNDIGRVVSPTIVRGQIDGGAVQGIGQALCERIATTRNRPAAVGQLHGLRAAARRRLPRLQDRVRHLASPA
jgi:carbon-monoxide dehydrogenase large subunit